MPDALSLAEMDGQQVELLPARTVLSLFAPGGTTPGTPGAGGGGPGGGMGGAAGGALGGLVFNWMSPLGSGTASGGHATAGNGGHGGNT